MPVASLTNVRLTYGMDLILDGISLSIEPGEKIGVVGRNGCGKSSMMKILAGLQSADSGEVSVLRGARVGYLAQDPRFTDGKTLIEEAESSLSAVADLQRRLAEVFESLSGADEARTRDLLHEQVALERAIEQAGGTLARHRVEEILDGVGFSRDDYSLPVEGLSGGQRARLALAKLLVAGDEVLAIDEPTNHLDMRGREWLEKTLKGTSEAVLMVSHDRRLLDTVVSRIVEIEDGRLIDYPGSFAAFKEQRAVRKLTQYREYEKQQDRFRKEEEYIRRYKAGQRAKQARGRETRLEREKAEGMLERPVEHQAFRVMWPAAPRAGDIVATLMGATKRYESERGVKPLFGSLDLKIGRGERWGIIGPNGAGKSTLVKCLLGEIPLTSGEMRLGANVIPGYLRQHSDHLDPTWQVFEYLQILIRREKPDAPMSEQAARDLAGAFLFSGEDQDKQVSFLSGGEKTRLMLAALLASQKNLLILDEPTNHLDLISIERLEQSLRPASKGGGFDGTLLLISHDRELIDSLCDHLLVVHGDGTVTAFPGNYSDWRRHTDRHASQPTQRAAASQQGPQSPPSKNIALKAGKNPLSWMSVEKLEARIADLTRQKEEFQNLFSDPAIYADPDRCREAAAQQQAVNADLERHEEEWLRRMDGV